MNDKMDEKKTILKRKRAEWLEELKEDPGRGAFLHEWNADTCFFELKQNLSKDKRKLLFFNIPKPLHSHRLMTKVELDAIKVQEDSTEKNYVVKVPSGKHVTAVKRLNAT